MVRSNQQLLRTGAMGIESLWEVYESRQDTRKQPCRRFGRVTSNERRLPERDNSSHAALQLWTHVQISASFEIHPPQHLVMSKALGMLLVSSIELYREGAKEPIRSTATHGPTNAWATLPGLVRCQLSRPRSSCPCPKRSVNKRSLVKNSSPPNILKGGCVIRQIPGLCLPPQESMDELERRDGVVF